LIIFIVVVICVLSCFYLVWRSMSAMSTIASQSIIFPTKPEDFVQLNHLLEILKQSHTLDILSFFVSLYLLKHTFCLPGSALLNILAGRLFGLVIGLPLVCFLTTLGGFFCYTISDIIGRRVITKLFPSQISKLSHLVETQKGDLFFFLLSLRIFPVTPNWMLNIASPIVGISPFYFTQTIFLGLLPYNFVCVQGGTLLTDLHAGVASDIIGFSTFLKLGLLALGIFGSKVLKNKLSERNKTKDL